MTIDTEKEYCLTNFAQVKRNKRAIKSDHCPMKLEMKINFSKIKPDRRELFNFRNKQCQGEFRKMTEETDELTNCFENKMPIIKQISMWEKKFFGILYKSFKKIRVNNKDNINMKSDSLKLQEERSELLKAIKEDDDSADVENERIRNKIYEIEMKLGEENAKENMNKIQSMEELGGESDCMNTNGMWKLKQKLFPKISPQVVTGKKDKHDKLVTDPELLKSIYLEEYL